MAQDSKDSIKSLAARMEKAKVEKENLLFAMNGYDELLRIKPNDAELWLGKAGVLEKTSYSLEDRLYCYEQAMLCDEKNLTAVSGTLYYLAGLKKKDEANSLYAKFGKNQVHKDFSIDLFSIAHRQTTLESAIWYWDWILELWPLWLTAQEGRISCYLQHNKKDEAIAVCDGQILQQPKSAQAWYVKGFALNKIAEHREAMHYFDEALKHHPDKELKEQIVLARLSSYFALDLLKNPEQCVKMSDLLLGVGMPFGAVKALHDGGKYYDALVLLTECRVNDEFPAQLEKKVEQEERKLLKACWRMHDEEKKFLPYSVLIHVQKCLKWAEEHRMACDIYDSARLSYQKYLNIGGPADERTVKRLKKLERSHTLKDYSDPCLHSVTKLLTEYVGCIVYDRAAFNYANYLSNGGERNYEIQAILRTHKHITHRLRVALWHMRYE